MIFFKKVIICILGVTMMMLVGCKDHGRKEPSFQTNNTEELQGQIEQSEKIETQSLADNSSTKSNIQWPKDFIPGVPELEGEISTIYFDVPRPGDEVPEPQFVRMEFNNIEEGPVDKFIEALKEGAYSENSIYEKNNEHTKYYVMDLPDVEGNRVYFKWNPSNKSAILSLLKPGFLALEAYLFLYGEDTGVEDLAPWPRNFLPNYPEPKGKIVNVDYFESDVKNIECTGYTVFIYYGDRQSVVECIREMKKRYYKDIDECTNDKELLYNALSDFYGDHKFDSASIYYSSLMGTTIEGGFELGERYNNISVYMSKAK